MFTGVVVENFSYVFQASGSGAKSITREQMRAFKKLWATFSNPKTGHLERQNFTKFFHVSPSHCNTMAFAANTFPYAEIERHL
jgi:hypothetical protein